MYEFALGIWRTFPPVWLVFGTIGNLMTIIVLMQRKNRNSSIARYLTALAAADLIVLWMALPRNWLYNGYGIDIRSSSVFTCKMMFFLLYFGSHSSVSLIVIVTIERFISTWQPIKVKRVCSTRNANIIIVSMVISLVLLDLHFLYGIELTKGKNSNVCYPVDETYAYFLFNIWSLMTLLVFTVTPIVIIVIANISIIIRVLIMRRKSRTQVIPHTLTTAARARQAKTYQVTTMLVTLNVVFIICVTPLYGFLLFYSDWVLSHGNDHSEGVLEMIWVITNALFYTNNAVNFILYFLSGSAFRKEAKTYFGQKLDLFKNTCRRSAHTLERNVNIRAAVENVELPNIGVSNT